MSSADYFLDFSQRLQYFSLSSFNFLSIDCSLFFSFGTLVFRGSPVKKCWKIASQKIALFGKDLKILQFEHFNSCCSPAIIIIFLKMKEKRLRESQHCFFFIFFCLFPSQAHIILTSSSSPSSSSHNFHLSRRFRKMAG